MMLMEIRKGYDLRRLTLGINLNLIWNLWKLCTWSTETSCCDFFSWRLLMTFGES